MGHSYPRLHKIACTGRKLVHRLAAKQPNLKVTDDCGLVLKFNLSKIFVIEGEDRNIKITYPEDISLAEKTLQLKQTIVPKPINCKDYGIKLWLFSVEAEALVGTSYKRPRNMGQKLLVFQAKTKSTSLIFVRLRKP